LKQKIILFLLLWLLQGCSFKSLLVEDEVNQVTVVNYTSYKKHHRAYFTRNNLQSIKNGKKYLYLYKKKDNDLAILLHRKNKYLLYSMSKPNQAPYKMKVTSKTPLSQVLKGFRKHGYTTISSLANRGYISSVSYKKYKGLKTLLVETKKYSRLQKLYRNAIKSYNARKVRYIKTKLPKQLIRNYYQFYKKRAKSREQFIQLQSIAKKLDLTIPSLPQEHIKNNIQITKKKIKIVKKKSVPKKTPSKKTSIQKEKQKALVIEEKDVEVKPTVKTVKTPPIVITKPTTKPFSYYLNKATLSELSRYISTTKTKASLSYTQYTKLIHKLDTLKETKLLNYGTLEELISEYKINKNPKYKQRIMSLMKDKQAK